MIQVLLVLKEPLVLKVLQDHQVVQVLLVLKDIKEIMVLLEHKVHKDFKDSKVLRHI